MGRGGHLEVMAGVSLSDAKASTQAPAAGSTSTRRRRRPWSADHGQGAGWPLGLGKGLGSAARNADARGGPPHAARFTISDARSAVISTAG